MGTTNKPTVLLLSSIHPANDPRIVHKIVPALATQFQVYCLLPNATTYSLPSPCQSLSIPFFRWIGWRILINYPLILWRTRHVKPCIIHIFVAELLPLAFLFHFRGVKVIYEVQENLYKKLPLKERNNHWLFRQGFYFFDRLARKYFHLVMTEESYYREYTHLHKSSTVIHNFSRKAVLIPPLPPHPVPSFVYSGVITSDRGVHVIIEAARKLKTVCHNFEIHFYGHLRIDLDALAIQDLSTHVYFHPYTDYPVLQRKLQQFWVGLALLQEVGDYPDSYPSKIFDYMAAGIPVIASHFPLYSQIISQNQCGLVVDPSNSEAVFQAMNWIIHARKEASEMGKRGKSAIDREYHWELEASKLLQFYDDTQQPLEK